MVTLDLLGVDVATGRNRRYRSGDVVNGAGTGDMLLAATQTITGAKSFDPATLLLNGATSGSLTLAAEATASGTQTIPNGAGTLVSSNTSDVSGASFVLDEDNMASDSATQVPTQQSVKAYVDAATAGAVTFIGGYDAATNTPDLDTAPSGISQGDMYTVTAAGTFFTEDLAIGDSIIAKQDNPTTLAHWTLVQKNIIDPVNAETVTLANEATDTDSFLTFATAATGGQALKTNTNLQFNSATGLLSLAGINADDITLSNGSALRTGTTASDTVLLQAYDVDGTSYTTFGTLTAGNTPTFDLSSAVTKGGEQIVTPSSTTTFTNKTFDANATGNSLSNVDVADFATGTDGALITWDANGDPTTIAPGTQGAALISQGNGAVPQYKAVEQLLSTTTGIDGTTTGTDNLYTVPTGLKAHITRVILEVTAVTGFTSVGEFGVGVAAGEDDIFSSTELTGLDATTKAYQFTNPLGVFRIAQAADVVKLGKDVAYTSTSFTITAHVFGYLLSA